MSAPSPKVTVLVLDEEPPWPPDSGKRNRTWGLISRLGSEFDVTMLTHRATSQQRVDTLPAPGVRLVQGDSVLPGKTGWRFYARLFMNLFSPLPYSVTSHMSNPMKKEVLRLTGSGDLIHCEWPPYAAYVMHVDHKPRAVAAHNVESDIWEGYFRKERNPLRKAFIYLQWQKMFRFEKTVFSSMDGIIAVSEQDAARIRKLGGRNVVVVENGVDTSFFEPTDESGDRHRIVFCGALDWRPNQDGLLWFVRHVFPLIRRRLPECRFTIVGRRPPATLVSELTAIDCVEMIGEVPDVRPHVAAANVVVVPLRIGSGTRLKIIEAWSMRRAVVSTTLGAAGLPARHEESALLADSPENFAAAVTRLLQDPRLRASLARAGRELAVQHFDWTILAKKQAAFWSDVVRRFEERQQP